MRRTQEELEAIIKRKDILQTIQRTLDTEAQKTGWEDMKSARACAGIPLLGDEGPMEMQMYNDSVSLARWYLKVWTHVYQAENDVKNNLRTEPTIDELVQELPARS